MLRNIPLLLAAAATLAAQTAPKTAPAKPSASKAATDKPQIDKAKVEAYIRHLFVWPPPVEIVVDDPQPGPVAGFYALKIHASQGNASQAETFYVSKDGQKIVRGTVFDLAQNPFKQNLDKIKTEFQPSTGTPGAPVVVVEFSDFECPFCREEAKVLRENLIQTYPKEVRLYYMDFPLESLHPWAKDAAMAGRCVFHQNASAFWDYHDWIFDHQEEITHRAICKEQSSRSHERQGRNRRGTAFVVHRFQMPRKRKCRRRAIWATRLTSIPRRRFSSTAVE